MNINDALSVFGVEGEYNPESIKSIYRKLCSLYHPDRNPAGLEMMKMVNEAYGVLKELSGVAEADSSSQNYGQDINTALQAIITLEGVEIEVAGTWVWVSGDTRPHKEILKESGFKWAMKKKMWFYRPEDSVSKGRGKYSIDEIRARHGSNSIQTKKRERLAA